MFIVDFLITLPIALYTFLMFPDTPSSTKAWYFSTEEKALAVSRMPPIEYKRGHLGKSTLKRVFGSWEIYGVSLPLPLPSPSSNPPTQKN